MMSSSSSTSKKRMAQQSQSLHGKKPHQNRQQQKCEENCKDHDLIAIPYLPTPIVTEILLRLRINALLSCSLVCKSWASIISSPEFAQLHLSKSPTTCLINPLNKHQSNRLHLVDPKCPDSLISKLEFIPKINPPNVLLWLINSCNGLICWYQLTPNYACNIFVCNPVLREYITLPKPPNATRYGGLGCLFGFSQNTSHYKVVLNYFSNGHKRTVIYTCGEASWKNIEFAPYSIRNNNYYAFLNGALHWIRGIHDDPLICCFDFEKEQFHVVPEPSDFRLLERVRPDQMRVGVINGKLSLCDFSTNAFGDRVVIIWVMKDYGVKESWTKDFVITSANLINHTKLDKYELIMIKDNGEILMIFNDDSLVLYDPKSKAFKSKQKIIGVNSVFQAIAHVPSLISLKDIAIGENVKVFGNN